MHGFRSPEHRQLHDSARSAQPLNSIMTRLNCAGSRNGSRTALNSMRLPTTAILENCRAHHSAAAHDLRHCRPIAASTIQVGVHFPESCYEWALRHAPKQGGTSSPSCMGCVCQLDADSAPASVRVGSNARPLALALTNQGLYGTVGSRFRVLLNPMRALARQRKGPAHLLKLSASRFGLIADLDQWSTTDCMNSGQTILAL